MKMLQKYKPLLLILVTGLILRIVFNSSEYSPDALSFVLWAKYLTTHRLSDLYEFLPGGYLAYPPLYYYVLILIGKLMGLMGVWSNLWLSLLIVKIPVFATDIGSTILIYQLTKQIGRGKSATFAAGFYFLNPAVIYVTSVWGQIDTIIIFLGLLTVKFLWQKHLLGALLTFIAGSLIKLQMLSLVPLLVTIAISQLSLTQLFKLGLSGSVTVVIPFLPLITSKGIIWIIKYFAQLPNQYPYTSVYAYNLWAPLGFIVSDKLKIFSFLEIRFIGLLFFWLMAGLVCWKFLTTKKYSLSQLLMASFLLFFAFAFFSTRIHSRYLIYTLGFLAPFASQMRIYSILFSVLVIANLLLPNKNPLFSPIVSFLHQPFSIMFFVGFGFSLFLLAYKKYQTLSFS